MNRRISKRVIYFDTLREFGKNSSYHGLGRIWTSKSRAWKIFWTFFFFLFLTILIVIYILKIEK